jgi:ribose 5-phosphate isomerase A
MTISDQALELIHDGQTVGLGTGRAATAFLHTLASKVRGGLRIQGVPTSEATAKLARELGIPLLDLEKVDRLDITVDGADEVDPQLNLIKGLGGALVREKIVAAASDRLVILVGAEKIVDVLGQRGVLPVEIVSCGLAWTQRRLLELGWQSRLRLRDGQPFLSDNGNHILDCQISPLVDPQKVETQIVSLPGVVGTGLFLGMAHTVLIQDGEKVQVRHRGG